MLRSAKFTPSITLAAFIGILPAAEAQDADAEIPEMPKYCELRTESEIVRVVVCTNQEMDEASLAEAGRAACNDKLPCGAWIWTDPEAAPATAPENHDGLTQDQITFSKGVWVAEKKTFISIDKVE